MLYNTKAFCSSNGLTSSPGVGVWGAQSIGADGFLDRGRRAQYLMLVGKCVYFSSECLDSRFLQYEQAIEKR